MGSILFLKKLKVVLHLPHALSRMERFSFCFPFRVARYEDFSMNPTNNTVDVFKFFGFSVHQKVLDFLDSHTKSNKGGVSSTFRD